MNNFLIFESLGLEYGKIDTKIDPVSFVLDEIQQVTKIVTSQSLARSHASSTYNFLSFSSSSASNMVKSTPGSSLYYLFHLRCKR